MGPKVLGLPRRESQWRAWSLIHFTHIAVVMWCRSWWHLHPVMHRLAAAHFKLGSVAIGCACGCEKSRATSTRPARVGPSRPQGAAPDWPAAGTGAGSCYLASSARPLTRTPRCSTPQPGRISSRARRELDIHRQEWKGSWNGIFSELLS